MDDDDGNERTDRRGKARPVLIIPTSHMLLFDDAISGRRQCENYYCELNSAYPLTLIKIDSGDPSELAVAVKLAENDHADRIMSFR